MVLDLCQNTNYDIITETDKQTSDQTSLVLSNCEESIKVNKKNQSDAVYAIAGNFQHKLNVTC